MELKNKAKRPETLAIMKLLVKKYNESKDDDVLQDGEVVSFDELAKAAKIPVDKLPDEEDREFRIIINHRLFEF